MHSEPRDQAAGLRRLLVRDSLRVLPVTAGERGVGKSTLLLGVAAAAARSGRNVIIVDPSPGEVATALGLTWRWDLASLLSGEREYRDVVLDGPEGIGILPAGRGTVAWLRERHGARELFAKLRRHCPPPGLVLVNSPSRDAAACAFLPREAPLLLVTRAGRDAVTATYSRLKDLVRRHGRRRFRLFVNRASEPEARALLANMAEVAGRFLGAELAWGGSLPEEAALRVGGPVAVAGCAATFAPLARALGEWPLAEYGAATH